MFSRLVTAGVRRQILLSHPRIQTKPFQWVRQQQFNGSLKRFNSTVVKNAPAAAKEKGIKALIKKYGYSALAVYLLLSCVDFPICFVIVHHVGVEKVHEYQALIKEKFYSLIGKSSEKTEEKEKEVKEEKESTEEEKKGRFWNSPLFTEAIVAYALHKSLVFIRLPITAAITPSFVTLLKRWGFKLGSQKITTVAQQAAAKTTQTVVGKEHANALNPKFGTSASRGKRWWNFFF